MNAHDRIKRALESIMTEREAGACPVYKGTDYNGVIQAYGWWYKMFNQQPTWLGPDLATALATIADIAESRETE